MQKNISRQRNRLAMVSAASRKIEHWTYEMGKLIFKRSIKVESQGDNLIIKDCTDRYGANLATKSVTHWSPGWLSLPGLPHHSVFPFQPECSVREDKISCRKRGLSLGKDKTHSCWNEFEKKAERRSCQSNVLPWRKCMRGIGRWNSWILRKEQGTLSHIRLLDSACGGNARNCTVRSGWDCCFVCEG